MNEYKGDNRLLLGIVFSVLTFWLFAQAMLNIAPTVGEDLGISTSMLNIGVSITPLFSGIFVVVLGGLADKFGRVKLTYIGLVLNIIGSFLLILSKAAILFVIGRAFQGLSAACIMPATISLVKAYYKGRERQRAVSFWAMGSWGGSGFCSLFGGFVATYLGWKYVFVFSIIISVLSFLLMLKTPESKVIETEKTKFDLLGVVVFVIVMLALNLFITKGSDLGIFSFKSILLLLVFVVGIIIFYKIEISNEHSFVDFSLFKNKMYFGATLSNFLINTVAGTLLIINTYVQQGRGLNAAQTGVLSLGYLVLVLITIRIGEKLLQKLGAKRPMIFGTLITALGVAFMSLTFFDGITYFVMVFIGYALFGVGLGMYATPSIDTAISTVSEEKVGVASGIYKMASTLGGAIGVAVSASIYSQVSSLSGHTTAIVSGLMVNVVFCLLSFLSIIVILKNVD